MRTTPGTQALVNLRNEHRKCDECAAWPCLFADHKSPAFNPPRVYERVFGFIH